MNVNVGDEVTVKTKGSKGYGSPITGKVIFANDHYFTLNTVTLESDTPIEPTATLESIEPIELPLVHAKGFAADVAPLLNGVSEYLTKRGLDQVELTVLVKAI